MSSGIEMTKYALNNHWLNSANKNEYLYVFAVFVLTFTLRMLLIGQAPFTDEGIYIAHSYFTAVYRHHPESTSLLPNAGPIFLYSNLLFWLSYLPGPPFLYWRLVDALVASCAAGTLFIFLRLFLDVFPAFFGAAAWTLAVNHQVFINAGFKNPICAATLSLLLALCTLHKQRGRFHSYLCGALVAFAVLLREPFAGYAIVIGVYIFCVLGKRKFFQYSVGGIFFSLVVVGIFAMLRGGLKEGIVQMVAEYRTLPKIYTGFQTVGGLDRLEHIWNAIKSNLSLLSWFIWLSVLGCCVSFFPAARIPRRLIFLAILLLLPPLWEICVSLCFPYHVNQLSLGLSLFAAAGFEYVGALIRQARYRKIGIAAVVVLCSLFIFGSQSYWRSSLAAWKESAYFAPVMLANNWNSPVVQDSFYLDAAQKIKRIISTKENMVVSGFYSALYPLSARLPYSFELLDITAYQLIYGAIKTDKITNLIAESRPDLIVQSNRFDKEQPITEFFPNFYTSYILVDSVPSGKRSYGGFDAKLWEKTYK